MEGSEDLLPSGLLTPAHQLSPSHRGESHLVLEAQGNIQMDAVSCDPSVGEDGVHHQGRRWGQIGSEGQRDGE